MIDTIKKWAYGVHRLSKQEINTIRYVRLLKAVPTKVDMNNLRIIEEVFQILHRSKSCFSFEIWKDKEIEFYFHASREEDEKELALQLNSVYPNLEVEQALYSIPEFKEGDYISGGVLNFKGQPFYLKKLDDFNYDPIVHILEAIDSGCIIQFLFKPTRKILEIDNGKSKHPLFNPRLPLFNCSIRAIAYSQEYEKARKSCERILNSFSVFNSHMAQLEPKSISFPVFRDSYGLLKSISKRRLPIFSKFIVTSKELTSFVHLPINAEDHGVRYARPTTKVWQDEP